MLVRATRSPGATSIERDMAYRVYSHIGRIVTKRAYIKGTLCNASRSSLATDAGVAKRA